MKTFQQFTEAFNTKLNWKNISGGAKFNPSDEASGFRWLTYSANLKDGRVIEIIYMYKDFRRKSVEIVFDVDNSTSATGGGSQMEIFGAVINHIKDWIGEHPTVRTAWFTAEKEYGADSSSRSKLYSRLIKRFASQVGFDIREPKSHWKDTSVTYELKRKK